MKGQAFNPCLPGGEYIPDGEPRIFDGRVCLYGSHDRFGAPFFCANDYVCWSAPEDDLSGWRYEGVIYRKRQDPKNRLGLRLLFAPDVVKGADGRFYLYYAFDFMGIMGVAVCDTPWGEFQFYGHVRYPDGKVWGRRKGDSFPFDPGVLVDDDGRVYLYSGFYFRVPAIVTGGKRLKFDGGYVLELEPDMVTIKAPQKLLFPKSGPGAFENHEFFEASSIRKYEGRYYFVYSSRHNHELCYAVSSRPTEGFTFGGTLVSNGDIFLDDDKDSGGENRSGETCKGGRRGGSNQGWKESRAYNYIGNNHGGMLERNGEYYIFYHRQTNRSSYARQACAERLTRNSNGGFRQAEMTSCGLNGGPLTGRGRYEARIACNLWAKEGTGRYDGWNPKGRMKRHPYFTQQGRDGAADARQYIANMRDGAAAGFKYFRFESLRRIHVTLRGRAEGCLQVFADPEGSSLIARIPVSARGRDWTEFSAQAQMGNGVSALYFIYSGRGSVDFLEFELE
ncbi:MAG: family 43 glycosylhydrolase [Acetatifactor sp.]|nr:family 43 glycosylhydrolase [Acetatifactor sp.]